MFDLNGVLVHHTFNGASHHHDLRPGVQQLLQLLPYYRLGIYSSATKRTVDLAIKRLQHEFTNGGKPPPPKGYFEVILCRDHCVLASELNIVRPGGKPWDTIKPLSRYFADLTQLVLVDDSPHKALPKESANMLLMPVWEGPKTRRGQNDRAITVLVEGLLRAAQIRTRRQKQVDSVTCTTADFRPKIAEIAAELAILSSSVEQLSLSGPPSSQKHDLTSLSQLVLATALSMLDSSNGASLVDINGLLSHVSPGAFVRMLNKSAKKVVNALIESGELVVANEGDASQGKRYSLAAALNGSVASLFRRLRSIDARTGSLMAAGGQALRDGCRSLVKCAIAILQDRSGVPCDSLDGRVVDALRSEPRLQEAMALKPNGSRGAKGEKNDVKTLVQGIRNAVKSAHGTLRSAGLLTTIPLENGKKTPPPLLNVTVNLSSELPSVQELLASATDEVAVLLRLGLGRTSAPVVPSSRRILVDSKGDLPLKPEQMIVPATGNGMCQTLPVFEDRGAPAAGVAPPTYQGGTDEAAQFKIIGDIANPLGSGNTAAFTQLHFEVMAFAAMAAPNLNEVAAVRAAVNIVDAAARSIWPESRAVLFGSQATGLALPGGDLDIVILGVGPQLTRAGSGFTTSQRSTLTEHLEDLLDALRAEDASLWNAQIIDAKVPIIKCVLRGIAGVDIPSLPMDISLGAANGAAAVTFLRKHVIALPPLRPLTLVVKALLRDRGLNEVFTGGLGSYAVVNLIISFLMEHGYKAIFPARGSVSTKSMAMEDVNDAFPTISTDDLQNAMDTQATFAFLERIACSQGVITMHSGGSTAAEYDLGLLLWGFLERFGASFDYARHAISVRLGGVVNKGGWKQPNRPWLLAVEDPQEPGRDICVGSYNVRQVRAEFAMAAEILAEACEDVDANRIAAASDNRGGLILTPEGLIMLRLLLDVECAVGRGPAGHAARRALEHRAATARASIKKFKRGSKIKRGRGVIRSPPSVPAQVGKVSKKRKTFPTNDRPVPTSRGLPRGSKQSRAVEAEWKDRRGQFFDPDESAIDPAKVHHVGGSVAQRRWHSGTKINQSNSQLHMQGQGSESRKKKKKKGIKSKRKMPGDGGDGAPLKPRKKKMKKSAKKRSRRQVAP